MSYEGYTVVYCVCGYRKDTRDAYDDPYCSVPCPICDATEEVWDSVNETNGCECDYYIKEWEEAGGIGDPPLCPAHEKVTQVVEVVGEQICPCCNGKGKTPINRYNVSMLRNRD